MEKLNLVSILPPPISPQEAGVGFQWPLIDDEYKFPDDYIDFINVYGTGRIADFIVIFNPFSKNDDVNFFRQKELIIEDFKYLINEDKDYYKYTIYPDENGLLPLGVTDNGDNIFWVTSPNKDSNSWGTAIVASRSPEVEYFDSGIVHLLENILSKKGSPTSLPDNFPPQNINFTPI